MAGDPVQFRLKIPEALKNAQHLVDRLQESPAMDADVLRLPRAVSHGQVGVLIPGEFSAVRRKDVKHAGPGDLSGGIGAAAVEPGLIPGLHRKVPHSVIQLVSHHLKGQRHLMAGYVGSFAHKGGPP